MIFTFVSTKPMIPNASTADAMPTAIALHPIDIKSFLSTLSFLSDRLCSEVYHRNHMLGIGKKWDRAAYLTKSGDGDNYSDDHRKKAVDIRKNVQKVGSRSKYNCFD